ncbi:hypothetical protein PHMEG_0007705 [Phytophthora megakarya]|uniref:Tc1-like transposase DDE domain-containing protein n=1 Tax=Phytophthora megakarya TaxID=4795 RepID=A0A225WLT2_9STRA|nr:hypothetical protein PHMEG_0007705 [Phytophthora megakarya]
MRDELQRMEVSYVRGRKRDPRADHEVNEQVLGQEDAQYINEELPDVYLDESYCNVNHVAPATWLTRNSPRYVASGAGQRYCIVEAGFVFVKHGRLHGEWVQGSIKTWVSHLKTSDDTDYHGNFTGELFETWFGDLCKNLLDTYGPCRIHMDGAAYHKVMVDPAPSSSTSKAKMVEWLHRHGVTVSIDGYKKKQLERLIAQAKPPTTYKTVVLAELYKHEVLYTPPYHPELQPIELI